MRMTQYIGLHKEARKFLENARVVAEYVGTYGLGYEPIKYKLYEKTSDGLFPITAFAEVTQCEPWSSGPVIFTCLISVTTGEKMFEWTKEEIEKYL